MYFHFLTSAPIRFPRNIINIRFQCLAGGKLKIYLKFAVYALKLQIDAENGYFQQFPKSVRRCWKLCVNCLKKDSPCFFQHSGDQTTGKSNLIKTNFRQFCAYVGPYFDNFLLNDNLLPHVSEPFVNNIEIPFLTYTAKQHCHSFNVCGIPNTGPKNCRSLARLHTHCWINYIFPVILLNMRFYFWKLI